MSEAFVLTLRARWVDMDFNQHMRNSAFLGCAEEARMRFLDAGGWSMDRFVALGLGPVVVEDRLTYRRELRLLEEFTVDLQLAGATESLSRMRVRNTFRRTSDGAECATVDSVVLWFDLRARRTVVPPDELADLWRSAPSTADFATL